jgi:hypothetical protein
MSVLRTFAKIAVSVLSLNLVLLSIPSPAQATACPANISIFQSNGAASYAACNFNGWDFTGLSISDVDFQTASVAGANFGERVQTPTTLTRVTFGNAVNAGAFFDHAVFDHSEIYLANFNNGDFADSDFTNGSYLHDAYFDGASFINADFSGAIFNNIWLRGANLSYSNVTQAQLDLANLSDSTICPDTYPLGDHVGNCFSALKAPIPVTTPPVVSSTGFTFDITNDTDYYTFTVAVTAGPGVASTGTPTGSTLPVAVTGAPPGSNTVVTITGSIGSGGSQVTSTTTYDYQAEVAKELARTGVNNAQIWVFGIAGSVLILFGAAAIYLTKRRKN